ncbi:MAG: hypothetical protein ABI346_05070 [Candidatus Baltobacteraceae bacterium]
MRYLGLLSIIVCAAQANGLAQVAPSPLASAARAASPAGATPGTIAASDTLSVGGVGVVRFGMTPAQAGAAGLPLAESVHAPNATCYFAHPAAPAGVTFMVRDGKIVRADLAAPADLKTVDGFKRGDVEGNIAGFYAGTKGGVSDFPLSSNSDVYLLASPEFSAGESVPRLVYELTDKAGVVRIHAGWVPRHFGGCPKGK